MRPRIYTNARCFDAINVIRRCALQTPISLPNFEVNNRMTFVTSKQSKHLAFYRNSGAHKKCIARSCTSKCPHVIKSHIFLLNSRMRLHIVIIYFRFRTHVKIYFQIWQTNSQNDWHKENVNKDYGKDSNNQYCSIFKNIHKANPMSAYMDNISI